jgi:bla regulator protein blaR1
MGAIWPIALSNAALVAAGTPLVWAVGRFARRPALTHALAVILLLKLITPPLWRIPITLPEAAPAPIARTTGKAIEHPASVPAESQLMGANETTGVVPFDPQTTGNSFAPILREAPPLTEAARAAAPAPVAQAKPSIAFPRWREWVVPLAQWVWVAGSVLCAAVAGARVVRFSRALRFATRAADVQPRANLLARRLGLRAAPPIWFVPGFVSPMLWSLARPRLLLPHALWERLDVIERDTILLHELAHWRRGDGLIRWIELLATCLYWWHPACWWTRRELREAEEQCCDAWVLWAMPGTFKNYANALLEAVEFASVGADRPSARGAVPALASRMGQFVHLRRRLTMLKHGNIARALSWGGLAGVMTLGSFVLPVAPTWGQDRPAPQPEPRVAPDVQPDPFAAPAAEPGSRSIQMTLNGAAESAPQHADLQRKMADLDRAKADRDRARFEADLARQMDDLKRARAEAEQRAREIAKGPTLPSIERMVNPPDPAEQELESHIKMLQGEHAMADLREAEQTIQQLKKQLGEAQSRLAELERRGAPGGFRGPGGALPLTPPAAPAVPGAPAAPKPPSPDFSSHRHLEYRVAPGAPSPKDVAPSGASARSIPAGPGGKNGASDMEISQRVSDGQIVTIIKNPTTGQTQEIRGPAMVFHVPAPAPNQPGATPGAPQADRLDRIEAQLKALAGEVERMRSAGATTPAPDRAGEARP